jgi:hypothetical protein
MRTILLAVILAVLTVVYPRWIELVTGADPDAGSGAVEAMIVLACVLVAFGRGVWLYRRLAREREGAG